MVLGRFTDLIELSDDVSLIEMEMPSAWVGKNLIELDLRNKYSVNVVAIKSEEKTDVTPDPKVPMEKDQTILISGRNEDIRKLSVIK
jgi:trk system potassium uptake protein TrkA